MKGDLVKIVFSFVSFVIYQGCRSFKAQGNLFITTASKYLSLLIVLFCLLVCPLGYLQLFQMLNGRKPCDLQTRKQTYLLHVKKLQQVKLGRSPFHRSLGRQRRDIDNLLKLSHRIHNTSLKEQFKRRELTELQCQRRSYNHIRSIVKSELNRKILPVPPKHKPNRYFLDADNLRLINKIVNAKSQFNFKRQSLEKLATARARNQTSEDYSQFYQKSIISKEKSKQIYLRMGKAKLNNKLTFRFLNSESLDCFKTTNLFAIQILCGDRSKLSKYYMLSEIMQSEISISFPENQITLNFMEKVGERMIKRFKLEFVEEQLASDDKIWTSKIIEDTKDRAIGLVEIEIKRRKDSLAKNTFFEQILLEAGDKENTAPQTVQHI